MKGSLVLRWTEKVPGAALWAIAATFAFGYAIIAFLAILNWRDLAFTVQVLHLLVLSIGFSVLTWGFWGGFISTSAACVVGLGVSLVAGHMSLENGADFARAPFFVECLLFILTAYLCTQYLQREIVEEKFDHRQLGYLEEEFLTLAIEYGKREELLKALEKKSERSNSLASLAQALRSAPGDEEQIIQAFLEDLAKAIGKGEVEITLYHDAGMMRYPRGAAAMRVDDGRDEVDRWLDEHRTALLVNNLTRDVRFTPSFGRAREIMSVVAVPLFYEGSLKGTLRLSSVVPQAFVHDDLRFASEAANLLLPHIFKGK